MLIHKHSTEKQTLYLLSPHEAPRNFRGTNTCLVHALIPEKGVWKTYRAGILICFSLLSLKSPEENKQSNVNAKKLNFLIRHFQTRITIQANVKHLVKLLRYFKMYHVHIKCRQHLPCILCFSAEVYFYACLKNVSRIKRASPQIKAIDNV